MVVFVKFVDMKLLVYVLTILLNTTIVFSQKESANWCINPNSLINFNNVPASFTYALPFTTRSNSACISDVFGNLLFYTDGDTVRGADGNVLPNGSDLSTVLPSIMNGTTQGSLFVKKPKSNDLYYLFSLGRLSNMVQARFSYSVIDKSLNTGLGSVVSSQNNIILDTLADKLTATKHCNGNDYWIVITNCIPLKLNDGLIVENDIEMLSYLLTEDGLQLSPVRSRMHVSCPRVGQMKFNNAGNELAFGVNNMLTLLSFDNSTGKFSVKNEIPLNLENAYGLEYSPNDKFVYINEMQYEISTNTLTQLYNRNYLSQLQRGLDGRIYSIVRDEAGGGFNSSQSTIIWEGGNDGWLMAGSTSPSTMTLGIVQNPDNTGVNCSFSTSLLSNTNPEYVYNMNIGLPNFPSFYFNSKISDFEYNGSCVSDVFQFSLSDPSVVHDSIVWTFHDDETSVTSTTANHQFQESGEWTVTCAVYTNGNVSYSTQCVDVCGFNSTSLPETINMCEFPIPMELNVLNTCATDYLWSTGDTVPAITIMDEGTYSVTVTNACGVFNYSVNAFKSDDCNVLTQIPNVLTLNDDGVNDLFSIEVKNAKSIEYSILNRWGNPIGTGQLDIPGNSVFDWNTISVWDGKTTDGLDVSDGTYFYVINFTMVNGSINRKNGFIEVFH